MCDAHLPSGDDGAILVAGAFLSWKVCFGSSVAALFSQLLQQGGE